MSKDYERLINAQCAIIHEKQNFLNDTDYKAIRASEGGEAEPEDTKSARAAARIAIDTARTAIETLEAEREAERDDDPIVE